MPSVRPIIKTVQATIDGLGRFLNVSGIGESVHGRATVQYQIGPSHTYLSVASCPGWSMK